MKDKFMSRYLYIIIGMVLCGTLSAFCQVSSPDTLSIEEGFFGMTYKKGTQDLNSKEFKEILQSSSDKTIYDLYSSGSTLSTISDVAGFAGGFCLGYGLFSKPINTGLTVAGGVIAVGAFILDSNGRNKMREAVSLYNKQNAQTSDMPPIFVQASHTYLFSVSINF